MLILKKVAPKIWHLHFEKQFDLTAHFMRFDGCLLQQKNKNLFFTLREFKYKYKKNYKKNKFTYHDDWYGFHIEKKFLKIFLDNEHRAFPDRNVYDDLMLGIIKHIFSKEKNSFSLIGTCAKESAETYQHEIAHALWTQNSEYRKMMRKNIATLDKNTRKKLYRVISDAYRNDDDSDALIDELQAYLATGLLGGMHKHVPPGTRQKFIDTFREYYKKLHNQ